MYFRVASSGGSGSSRVRQKSKRSCQYIIAHQSDKPEGMTEPEFKNLQFQSTQYPSE